MVEVAVNLRTQTRRTRHRWWDSWCRGSSGCTRLLKDRERFIYFSSWLAAYLAHLNYGDGQVHTLKPIGTH